MYEALKETFRSVFGTEAALLFSAPGRTELCGNHTDHQGGMVLAAAVQLETAAAVRPREDGCIRLLSEGYPMCTVQLDAAEPRAEETGTTAALSEKLGEYGAATVYVAEHEDLDAYLVSPKATVLASLVGSVSTPDTGGQEAAPAPQPAPAPSGPSCTVTLPELRQGDTGTPVERLQTLLISRGYYCGGRSYGGREQPDGEFGPATEVAVKDLQLSVGISQDGVVGSDTWPALIKS